MFQNYKRKKEKESRSENEKTKQARQLFQDKPEA